MREETFYCDCRHGCISIISWDEGDSIEIAMFERMPTGISWRFRLEHIWKIITTGTPYLGDIVLTKEDTVRMRDMLNQVLEVKNGSE